MTYEDSDAGSDIGFDSDMTETDVDNENWVQASASTLHAIQAQRDDRAMGRPNTRAIRPLPKWTQFRAVGKRGERNIQ